MDVGRLSYVALTEQAAARAAAWVRSDPEGQRWMASYAEHPGWWSLVANAPDRHGWIVTSEQNRALGFIDLEIEGRVGYVALFIVAEVRGLGIGRRVLCDLDVLAGPLGAAHAEGSVDPSNTSSLRMCAATGFVPSGLDHDRYLVMQRMLDDER